MGNQVTLPGQPGLNSTQIGGAILTPFDLIAPGNIISNFGNFGNPSAVPSNSSSILPTSASQAAANVQTSASSGVPVLKPVTGNDVAVNSIVTNNAANADAASASASAVNGQMTLAMAQKNLANAEKRLANVQLNLKGVRELTPAQQTVLNASQAQVKQAQAVVAGLKNGSIPTAGQPAAPAVLPASNLQPNSGLQSAWDQLFGQSGVGQGFGMPAAPIVPNSPVTNLSGLAPSLSGVPANPPASLSGAAATQGLQVLGNAANLPKVYLEWKRYADIDDYLSARKYLTWKTHCDGRSLDDWMKYNEWKPTWNTLRSQVPYEEFDQWKKYACEDEAKKYLEWRKWRSIKQHYKCKYEPYRQRNLTKRQKMYKKFVKRATIEEYRKYKKFLVWAKTCVLDGKDMYDISAYNDWAPTYIESDKQVCEDYNKWKGKGGSREDYDKFVEYLLFRKVKQAYKDETEASEDSCPGKFYKDGRFLRRHRRYWKAWDSNWNKEEKYDD